MMLSFNRGYIFALTHVGDMILARDMISSGNVILSGNICLALLSPEKILLALGIVYLALTKNMTFCSHIEYEVAPTGIRFCSDQCTMFLSLENDFAPTMI